MMTANAILVRHGAHGDLGQVLSGRGGGPLAPLGRAQADRLAAGLSALPIGAIVSSPQRRTRETARAIAAVSGAPLTIDDDLDEVDFGTWQGASFAALADDPAWQAWNADRAHARCPGGETMAEVALRMWRGLRHADDARDTIALVSHCDTIRALVALILGIGYDAVLRFDVDPASATRLRREGADWRLATLNERFH